MRFCERFSAHLDSLGITVYELAKHTSLEGPLLYRIANGERRPSQSVLEKLSQIEILGLSHLQLFMWFLEEKHGRDKLCGVLRQVLQEEAPELVALFDRRRPSGSIEQAHAEAS